MTRAKQKPQERTDASALAMARGFRGFAPESEKPVRPMDVRKDKSLEKLGKAHHELEGFINPLDGDFMLDKPAFYKRLCGFLDTKGLPTSSADIERFSLALEGLQGDRYFFTKTGMLLSYLMKKSEDSGFVIHTSHLERKISYIGFQNAKNIVINGFGGESVGAYMLGGTILVNGNSDGDVGYGMQNGEIAVSGNSGSVGSGMHDGRITIGGNAGDRIGSGMKGGSILINGNSGQMVGGGMSGGEITIKGDAGGMIGDAMEGGVIRIAGNAGYGVGVAMKGGKIMVAGSVGEALGNDMRGGEIHVEGDIGKMGWVIHGKIYHRGKLIVER